MSTRWAALVLALGAMGACGQTLNTGSGETHFLASCDEGCGDRLECLGAVCTRPCEEASSCSDLGANASCVEHAGQDGKTCDQLCNGDQDCRGLGAELSCVAGACRVATGPTPNAGGSGSGGTPMMIDCSTCGSTRCAINGDCSLEAACAEVGCGGPTIDDAGCVRPECEDDSTCDADARCASVPTERYGLLTGCALNPNSPDQCACSMAAVGGWMKVCSPTSVVGPRGQWQSVTVTESGLGGATERIFHADGSVQITQRNGAPSMMTAELTEQDLSNLEQIVAGHVLRPLLTSSAACPGAPDYEVEVTLELDTTTLTKSVYNCPDDKVRAVVASLIELAQHY